MAHIVLYLVFHCVFNTSNTAADTSVSGTVEKCGDTKVVIRSDKLSKGRQYNDIKRKEKKTKQWTTERLIKMSPTKTGELWCFGKVNSSRYTSVCRCVARIKNAVKNKIENNVCHCVILKPRLCKDKHH
jgi:hypothetical protein